MEKEAREVVYQTKKAELLAGLESHVAALEELEHSTGFDFDVATDVHPRLIDNTTPEGRARLQFWQDVYGNLAKEPRYTVIRRYSQALEPGCYGFGATPEYYIDNSWIRVFEDLRQEDIKFVKYEDGVSRVTIDHPSTLFAATTMGAIDGVLELSIDLFSNEPYYLGFTAKPHEQYYEPDLFFYQDFEAFAVKSPEIMYLRNEFLPLKAMDSFHDYKRQLFADMKTK